MTDLDLFNPRLHGMKNKGKIETRNKIVSHPQARKLVTLMIVLLSLAPFSGCRRPERGSGSQQDPFCEKLLQDSKNKREALQWINESRSGDVRTLGEQSPEKSAAFVRNLYTSGAKQVWAVDIESDPQLGQSTNILIVELPVDRDARMKLFKIEDDVAASGGFDPVSDEGQHYMFLSKFKSSFGF